jgi:4-diphosphocytidyl-2-C-methyl-D-erythritol kinase
VQPTKKQETMILTSPAKLNLFLHITNKFDDGYHELQSLVAFTDFGDKISMTPSDTKTLTFTGEFGNTILPHNNSVTRTWNALELYTGRTLSADITIQKNIPIGAGLGGGSSNAATIFHALIDMFDIEISHDDLIHLASQIGSDVPVCLHQQPMIISGKGEICTPAPSFPTIPVVILYPRFEHLSRDIYQSLSIKQFSNVVDFPEYFESPEMLAKFLMKYTNNDLIEPALQKSPTLKDLLHQMGKQKNSLLTRMTGSGSACFSLFTDTLSADNGLKNLQKKFPDYWGISTYLIGG